MSTTLTKKRAKASPTLLPSRAVPSPVTKNLRGHFYSVTLKGNAPETTKAAGDGQEIIVTQQRTAVAAQPDTAADASHSLSVTQQCDARVLPLDTAEDGGQSNNVTQRGLASTAALKNGEGQESADTHCRCAISTKESATAGQRVFVTYIANARHADSIALIRELQFLRRNAIKLRIRIDNNCIAIVARALGYESSDDEKTRDERWEQASKIRKLIEKEKDIPPELVRVANAVRGSILSAAESSAPWEHRQDEYEAAMRAEAEKLPVFAWWNAIPGLAALGLAIIVGEVGDIGSYRNPSCLWKRLGLAPKLCYAMETKAGDMAHAIPRARRSQSWVVADSMLRKDNAYRKIYLARKEYEVTQHPEFLKERTSDGKIKATMHCDRRSRRYAEKALLKDLWQEWRRTIKL